MRKKLADTGGVSIVEMLCATIILILLGLLLNSGLQLSVKSYRELTAESETQLLLATAIDALADDLRYARKVETVSETDNKLKSYFSDSYGKDTTLTIGADGDTKGQLLAAGQRVLPPGAYGKGAYQIQNLNITYDKDNQLFTVKMEVIAPKIAGVGAKTPDDGVIIRCLNPAAAPETPGEGEGTP